MKWICFFWWIIFAKAKLFSFFCCCFGTIWQEWNKSNALIEKNIPVDLRHISLRTTFLGVLNQSNRHLIVRSPNTQKLSLARQGSADTKPPHFITNKASSFLPPDLVLLSVSIPSQGKFLVFFNLFQRGNRPLTQVFPAQPLKSIKKQLELGRALFYQRLSWDGKG